jgi:hypothetical protein
VKENGDIAIELNLDFPSFALLWLMLLLIKDY